MELLRRPELDSTSVALLAAGESGVRDEIHEVSERAGEAGVRPGMRLSRALALCPSLILLEPDPVHYAMAMSQIVETLERISPIIQTQGEGVIHIGTDGLDRLHGPPNAQTDIVLHTLLEILPPPMVASVRAGWAPGLFGSRVAAHSARPGAPVIVPEEALFAVLARQPVGVLPVSDEMIERLTRLNIHTLGALGKLPLSALLRHFGEQGREARALALGERIDPVRPLQRPEPIRVSMDFASPVGGREALHHGMAHLTERGLARPERRGRSIRGVRVGGFLESGGSWDLEMALRQPTADRREIVFVLESRVLLSPPPRALLTLFVEFFEFGAPDVQDGLFDRLGAGSRNERDAPLERAEIAKALREALRLHSRCLSDRPTRIQA
jgi:protein ImuB